MANGTPAAVQQLVAACLAASWLLEPSEVSVMIRFAGRIHLALLPHTVLSQRLAGLVVAGTGALTGSVVYTLRSPLVGLSMTRFAYKQKKNMCACKRKVKGLACSVRFFFGSGGATTKGLRNCKFCTIARKKQGCQNQQT